jgi:hypothetical protein
VETLQEITAKAQQQQKRSSKKRSSKSEAAKSEAAAKAKRPIEDFRKNECRSVRRFLPHGLRYSYYGVVLVFLL